MGSNNTTGHVARMIIGKKIRREQLSPAIGGRTHLISLCPHGWIRMLRMHSGKGCPEKEIMFSLATPLCSLLPPAHVIGLQSRQWTRHTELDRCPFYSDGDKRHLGSTVFLGAQRRVEGVETHWAACFKESEERADHRRPVSPEEALHCLIPITKL